MRVALLAALVASVPVASAGSERTPVLAFVAELDGQRDLFLWDDPLHDGPVHRLTDTAVDEAAPSIAPGGNLVVYSDSSGHVFARRLDQDAPWRVSGEDEAGLLVQPDVAPDGRTLVCARRLVAARDDTELALVDLDPDGAHGLAAAGELVVGPGWARTPTSGRSRLLPDVSSQFFPAWSPDGRRLAYTHLHSRLGARLIAEIWEARVDHSVARQLTWTDALCVEPSWSPDGTRVVFSSDQQGHYDLFEVEVGNRSMERLTDDPGAETEPAYAPDGRHVVFVSTQGGTPGLWLLDRSSRDTRPLRPFGATARACAAPAFGARAR